MPLVCNNWEMDILGFYYFFNPLIILTIWHIWSTLKKLFWFFHWGGMASLCLLTSHFFTFLFSFFSFPSFPSKYWVLSDFFFFGGHSVFLSMVIFELDKKSKINLQSGWDQEMFSHMSNVLHIFHGIFDWLSRVFSASGICGCCIDMCTVSMCCRGAGLWPCVLLTCTGCTEHRGPSSRSDWFLQRKWLPWLGCVRLWLCAV